MIIYVIEWKRFMAFAAHRSVIEAVFRNTVFGVAPSAFDNNRIHYSNSFLMNFPLFGREGPGIQGFKGSGKGILFDFA